MLRHNDRLASGAKFHGFEIYFRGWTLRVGFARPFVAVTAAINFPIAVAAAEAAPKLPIAAHGFSVGQRYDHDPLTTGCLSGRLRHGCEDSQHH